jgi:uncharacterized protein YgiM (DUF1202 family)
LAGLPAKPGAISVSRVAIEPTSVYAPDGTDPSGSFVVVESGQIAVRIDVSITVSRAAAAGATQEPVPPGTEVTLGPGDSFWAPPLSAGEVRNDGTELAVLLVVSIMPAADGTGDTVVVIADGVNLRAEPSVEAPVVTELAARTELTVTGPYVEAEGYVWVPVATADGLEGYVTEDWLEPAGEPAVEPTTAAAPTQPSGGGTVVTTQSVELRSEPAESEDNVIDVLDPGTELTTLGETVQNNNIRWVLVATEDGQEGWVDAAYLESASADGDAGSGEGGSGVLGLLPNEAELSGDLRQE